MHFTPMKRRFGWYLEKGSIDWKLYDANGGFLCTIKITHPGNEIIPMHVHKVKKMCQERGLIWEKKSQKKK